MKLNHPIYGEIDIPETELDKYTLTNVYPLGYDPYNTPYESINWAETYKYYPPGDRYLNPFQRVFPPTKTTQLKIPSVIRIASTPITTSSKYNKNPPVVTYNNNFS
jgi:hypothetical protein